MDLYTRIMKLRPDATVDDFVLVDNGSGPFIEQWLSTKITQPTDAEIAAVDDSKSPAMLADAARWNRRMAYQEEADALFFEEQAGEVAAGTWAAKRSEIKERFPK